MTAPLLRFEDVSLAYGAVKALDRVSFELRKGESRVIFGEAGSGKTTLLKTAAGLIKPDSGRVFLFEEDITTMKESRLFDLRARVGFLFQEGGLFDSLTIEENVAYPLENQKALDALAHRSGRTVEARVEEALTFVELGGTLQKFPSELSGGMRRRVGIARALVTEPALVLYDSPTAGLDPITANTIVALLLKERELRGAANLVVTHRFQDGQLIANFRYNPSSGHLEPLATDTTGASVTTRFFVMKEGRLVFDGTQAELRASTDPYVKHFSRPGFDTDDASPLRREAA